jgi:hypothetical protein
VTLKSVGHQDFSAPNIAEGEELCLMPKMPGANAECRLVVKDRIGRLNTVTS